MTTSPSRGMACGAGSMLALVISPMYPSGCATPLSNFPTILLAAP
ncbi:hypothetical protein ABZ639_19560 [Saccharomonospora sp. NPDC006951]